jgi:hypothetical protein
MTLRPMTTLRNVATALVLFLVALACVEFWLRGKSSVSTQGVTNQTTSADQVLLVPSAVCHHELQRMLKKNHEAGPGTGQHLIRVNSFGCRGEEPELAAADGTIRILILGDDSICGTTVNENETVSARLQQFLSGQTTRPLEVLNGGIPGYCPLLSWLKFDQDLAKLKPDLVILHVDMSDIADDLCYRSLLLNEDNHAVCSHPTLRLKPKRSDAVASFIKQSATANWLFTVARERGPELLSLSPATSQADQFEWIGDDPPDLRLQIRHSLEPITRLKESVEATGGRLLVTTSPVLWQVVAAEHVPELSRRFGIRGQTPYHSRFPFEILEAFCEHVQIRFFDTSTAFTKGEDAPKLFSSEAPVLSRIGMALYAREMARYLITNPLADW